MRDVHCLYRRLGLDKWFFNRITSTKEISTVNYYCTRAFYLLVAVHRSASDTYWPRTTYTTGSTVFSRTTREVFKTLMTILKPSRKPRNARKQPSADVSSRNSEILKFTLRLSLITRCCQYVWSVRPNGPPTDTTWLLINRIYFAVPHNDCWLMIILFCNSSDRRTVSFSFRRLVHS